MTKTFGLNRSLGGAIAIIALVAVLGSAAVLTTQGQLQAAIDARGRSNLVLRSLYSLRIAMLNQETGLRGYLLTGRPDSLEPYRQGMPMLDDALGRLHALIGGDAVRSGWLAEAEKAARSWQDEVAEAVIRGMSDAASRPEAARIESDGTGKAYFDTFRARLDAIQTEEERLREMQGEHLARAQRIAAIVSWVSTLLTLLICASIGAAIHRKVVGPLTRLAEAMRRLSRRDLTADVPATHQHDEVGAMARAVQVFKDGLIELDRTSLLRATADTLPAMVGYIDARRRVGFLNGEFERWFDLEAEDISLVDGRPLAQVFAADPFPGIGRELDEAFAGTEVRFEHRLARRGLGRREVEAFYRPHRGADGRVLGVVTLLTDITERKRMERRLALHARDLRRTNEELEQFAYVASHDLKAPLRGIENLVTWIEEDLEAVLTGDTRTNMELLKSRVRRLESLLDDLLAYSRAGRGDVATEPVDTQALVEELAGLISPPEGFSIVAGNGLPTLDAARAPLTQALQNLIGNAVKHHDRPAEGHVWVDAHTLGGMVEFSVTDDGAGIPEQFRERVFGMFQTLRPRDEVEGSGMGLAIVRKLVDRQGGKIWLDDNPKGRGLSVHFTWPDGTKGTADGTDRELAAG
ncbi:Adaptive-response sensory-kinase SasA [Methylobacterium crusticola]|uniref:histidine kinase n=1 Tax=Methylobacterium crusticola TaxID=1697972 RepID=A0ABQ4QXV7_9HYPH|nr:ATP-binding protein [Methylobacterium crusticola]GJD49764.1 Adaptive-response sensory-kinase SasA [Methylobacterium crusticola]